MAKRNKGRRLMGEINVVPYIDVMLVLLIIFMVTAPLLTQGIEVDLPDAAAEALDDDQFRDSEPLILTITANGSLYLNIGSDEDDALDEASVVAYTSAVLRRAPDTAVLVRADSAVPYGRVVTGMVLLQNAGARTVGFVTEPQDLPQAAQ